MKKNLFEIIQEVQEFAMELPESEKKGKSYFAYNPETEETFQVVVQEEKLEALTSNLGAGYLVEVNFDGEEPTAKIFV